MDRPYIECFDRCVRDFPENEAVGDTRGSLTYAQLGRLSDAVASWAARILGDASTRRIAVVLPRRKEFFAAIFGILKAGGAYVPIEPDFPDARIADILEEAGCTAAIVDESVLAQHPNPFLALPEGFVLSVDDPSLARAVDAGAAPPPGLFDPKQEGAVHFTSGSTGRPKGVARRADQHGYFPFGRMSGIMGPGVRFACLGRFSFVATSCFALPPLASGGFVYVLNWDEMSSVDRIAATIRERHLNFAFMAPKLAVPLLEAHPSLPLKGLVTGGDALRRIPQVSFPLFNHYGSTESPNMLAHQINVPGEEGLMGRPIEGTEVFVVDEDGALIEEPGITGELCVDSPYLAIGYLNRPDDELAKFCEFSFVPGKRLFRTGDLMRWVDTPEGLRLRYVGRSDNMVKINGQRVELEEVERTVIATGLVDDALCAVRDVSGTDVLCCYFVEKSDDGSASNGRTIREKLEALLPQYMIPTMYRAIPEVPRNANGKIDRSFYSRDAHADGTIGDGDRVAATDVDIVFESEREETIYRIVRRELGGIAFDPEDDLLTIGANSLAIMRIADALYKEGVFVRATEIMRHRSVRSIAKGATHMIWFHADYNPTLPTICYLCGVTVVSHHLPRLNALSESFNVVVIEPIQTHFEKLFDSYDFDEVVECYTHLLKVILPKDANVVGFMGNSFGGDLASNVARRLAEKTGTQAPVIMGDTYIGVCQGPLTVEDILNDPHNRMEDTAEEQVHYMNIVYYLNRDRGPVKPYGGHVLYLEAESNDDVMEESAKIAIVQALFEDLEILPLPEVTHYELSTSEELAPLFHRLAKQTFLTEEER